MRKKKTGKEALQEMLKVFTEIYSFISENHIVAVFFICSLAGTLTILFGNTGSVKNTASTEQSDAFSSVLRKRLMPASFLLIYSVGMTILLIFPPTATVFRFFQTVFFRYSALWTMVPLIPVTAFVLTSAAGSTGGTGAKTAIPVFVSVSLLILLCGSLGTYHVRRDILPGLKEQEISYDEAAPVLSRLAVISESDPDLVILATPAITAYSHFYSGHIKTLFGRDIWDISLGAYNYSEYSDDLKDLYEWMLYSDAYGCICYKDSGSILDDFNYDGIDHEALFSDPGYLGGPAFAKMARELGCGAIVFSVNAKTDRAGLECLEKTLSAHSEYINVDSSFDEGYLILYLD